MSKPPKFHNKLTIHGGGGGHSHGGSHNHTYGYDKSDSFRQKMHRADFVILSSKEGIEIFKNRWEGDVGFISSTKFIDVSLRMLAKHLYNGLTQVFQEAFVEDARKALTKVMAKHSKAKIKRRL